MDKSLEQITGTLITVTQRDYFVESLGVLQQSLYSSHQSIYELTSLALSLPWSEILVRMYRDQNLLENDKDGCKAVIGSIRDAVSKLESVEMRIAYNIPEADVKDISNWLFYQFKRRILLNIIVDQTLIGGMVLYRNGRYKDYSIGSYVDQYGRV